MIAWNHFDVFFFETAAGSGGGATGSATAAADGIKPPPIINQLNWRHIASLGSNQTKERKEEEEEKEDEKRPTRAHLKRNQMEMHRICRPSQNGKYLQRSSISGADPATRSCRALTATIQYAITGKG